MDEGSHSLSSKHIKSVIKTVFAIAFIGIVFYEGKKGLSSIKISDVKTVLKSLPLYLTILLIIGGILAVCTSSIHDLIISKELSVKLPKRKVFKIGLLSNTLNNISGGISSASVRAILYGKEGIKVKESTYYNILIVTSFSTGLSALTLIVLLNLRAILPIFKQYEFALIATIIIIFYIPLFFIMNKFKWIKKKLLKENANISISYDLLKKLFMSSIVEWTIAALFFTLISLYFSPNAKFIDIFSVFIISSVVGVVSLVPGAIGAFDVTLLLGMSTIQIDSNKAVATLMAFRMFYYIVPLIIALFIATPELLKKGVK